MGYKGFLRANTAVTLKLGPFLDSTNGNDNETALTIAQADVRLSKNGGNMAQKNESTSCTHDELGKYDCPIDATDTNTEGRLDVTVHESGALIVDDYYTVLAEAAYDSLMVAKDTGYMDVNIKAVSEDTTAADNLELITEISNITSLAVESDGMVHSDVKEVNGTAQTANDNGADINAILADTNELQTDDVPGLIAALNDLSAADVNAQCDASIESYHLDHLLAATYDPASKPGAADALLNELVENDSGVSRFTANSLEEAPTGGSAPTVEEIADQVWDEAQSGHVGAGTFGEVATEIASILADTNELQTDDIPGTLSTMDGKLDTIDNFLDTEVAAILADTNELQTDLTNGGRLDLILDELTTQGDTNETKIDTIITDTNELQTDLTNGGRLDLILDAILADTNALQTLFISAFAEVTSKPAAGAALANKLAFLFHAAVNKGTFNKTTGVHTMYQSNGSSTLATRDALIDDGTTVTTPAVT